MLANTQKQLLEEHCFAVGYVARAILKKVTQGYLDENILNTAFLSGVLHDLGKIDPEFQKWVTKSKDKEAQEDGYHIDKPTAFSFEKYPRHHEISLLLFMLLRDISDKKINQANVKLIQHVIYWHHTQPLRTTPYEVLEDIFKPLHKSLGSEGLNNQITQYLTCIQDIKKLGIEYDKNLNCVFPLFLSEFNDSLLGCKLPDYKKYKEQDLIESYQQDITEHAYQSLVRSAVISADRLVSQLSAKTLTQWITEKSLDQLVQAHFESAETLAPALSACLKGFEERYPHHPRNQQQTLAAEALAKKQNVAVLKGAAGCGKTKIALEWALNTQAQKIIWVCPRVQICQSLFHDLTQSDYLPDAKVEIYTGEFKLLHEKGELISLEDSKGFVGDVVITTLDQILNTLITHQHITALMQYMNAHIVFDEYHEYIGIPALNLLFAELIHCKKEIKRAAKTLLVSATPHPFFLNRFLGIRETSIVSVETFNTHPYFIEWEHFDEDTTQDNHPLYALQPPQTFVISNTATTAQLSYLQNEEKENAILLHSKFKKSDKSQLFEAVIQSFSKGTIPAYDLLRSGPIVQASFRLCPHFVLSQIKVQAKNTIALKLRDNFSKRIAILLKCFSRANKFSTKCRN